MKVFLSADIEGITGVVSWSQSGGPDADHYDFGFARRMMTHDVNAAVRGAMHAGAELVVIKDSHGNSKNLLIDELESGVELISGHGIGTEGMMQGLGPEFDCAILIGYHAMAGTETGILEHTLTGGVHRIFLNGIPCGEIGLSAGIAGGFNLPIVAVSSDSAGCAEAAALIPGVATAAVKHGFARYMGRLRHPSETERLIFNAVAKGISDVKQIKPVQWEEPAHIRIEFNRAEEVDLASRLSTMKRVDAYALEGKFSTFHEAHRAVWLCISLEMQGLNSQS